METLSLFLLKSIIISGLLTAWYLLGLRGRRLHQYNRFFLLSTLFASLTIPFLHFRLFNIPNTVTGNFAPVALFIQSAGDISNAAPALQQPSPILFDWTTIVGITVVSISFMLLLVLSARILKILKMRKQYPVTRQEGISLVLTDSPTAPFTFLSYLFWNRSIPLDGEVSRLILRHELTHIEQGHTYDKLVCQVLTCLFWFNPFYWIIQKELNIVHEFIADEQAVDNRNTETFAMMLLRSYNNGSYMVPEHHFFSSAIKRRVAMLQNAAKPSYALLRQFMVAPLIAGTILLFSCSSRNGVATHINPAQKKIIVLLDAAHGGTDIGAQAGGYAEKEICLAYARRINELSSAYNVEVRLTRNDDRDIDLPGRINLSKEIHPDVFISLHVGTEPGTEKGKGDFDIYISGGNAYAQKNSNYSGSIFQAMAQNGIIPGIATECNHAPGVSCSNCSNATTRAASQKDGIYVLKHANAPSLVMILGNINNKEGMQALVDNNQRDVLCNAILKGIVDGATVKTSVAQSCAPCGTTSGQAAPYSFNNFTAALPN